MFAYFGNSRLEKHISMNFDSISTTVFRTALQLLSDKETAIYFHVLVGFNFEIVLFIRFHLSNEEKKKKRRKKGERKRETKEEKDIKEE